MHPFFRIDGANGATFFLNLSNAESWRTSLEFYRPLTMKAQAKRHLLLALRPFLQLRQSNLLSKEECRSICCASVPNIVESSFGLDSSAMISPTRDKVIIHRHGSGYYKFAARKSFFGLVREIEIYQLLNAREPHSFCFSKIAESHVGQEHQNAGFFMQYAQNDGKTTAPSLEKIREGLSEFFSFTEFHRVSWQSCWEQLAQRSDAVFLEERALIEKQPMSGDVPLGLVHRDFKPWNIRNASRLQFFDFEETVLDGLPLEDLFNYLIDPLVNYTSPVHLIRTLEKIEFQMETQRFLSQVGTDDDWRRFWRWYLLERRVFWLERKSLEKAKRFQELYEFSERYGY